jgi:hypothetical protein
MKLHYLIITILLSGFLNAQDISKVELKEMYNYGLKKLSESPRKVFIESFRVNYQLFSSVEESSQGGRTMGGGVRGNVSVKLSVGLDGLKDNAVVETTDQIYQDFVERLKKEGYEIVPFEKAIGIKEYEGWERMKGGTPSRSQFKGYVTVSPSNFEYFVKKVREDGKEKGTFLDNGPKVSKELDEALVIKVTITIPFCHDAESTGSKLLGDISKGIVNVALESGMRMSSDPLSNATIPGMAGVTSVAISRGGKKMGDYSTGTWALKKDIEISGTMEKKKFKEGAVANSDVMGTDLGMFQLFKADNIALDKMQKVKVDLPAYQKGAEMGANKFLNMVMDEIMSFANR